jgi:hypothetical protein
MIWSPSSSRKRNLQFKLAQPIALVVLSAAACVGCAERVQTERDACAEERQPLIDVAVEQTSGVTTASSQSPNDAGAATAIRDEMAAWNGSGYSRGPDELARSQNTIDRLISCRIAAANGITHQLATATKSVSGKNNEQVVEGQKAAYGSLDKALQDDDRLISILWERMVEPQRKTISREVDALADVRPYAPDVDVTYAVRPTVIYAATGSSSTRLAVALRRARLPVVDEGLSAHWYRVRWKGLAGYVASRDVAHSRPITLANRRSAPQSGPAVHVNQPAPDAPTELAPEPADPNPAGSRPAPPPPPEPIPSIGPPA